MSGENLEKESLETLEALAEQIVRCATEADERVIEAARLIRVARARVEEGEAGDITWYEWARNNIDLGETRLRELQRIADAEDPQKELETLREKTRKRVGNHRQKNKKKQSAPLRNDGATTTVADELEEDRQRLIDWARSEPLERVKQVLSYIEELETAEAVSGSDQPAEPVAA